MKRIIFVLALLPMSLTAQADPELICSLIHSKKVIQVATKHSRYDKNRHCSVSCMLALKCPSAEVALVGLLKEIKDLFGPGEADREDIKADLFGISLAEAGVALSDKQCLQQCDLYYPNPVLE